MKVRLGFVSNSSSTSFCVYGKFFEANEVFEKLEDVYEKHLNKYKEEVKKNFEEHGEEYEPEDCEPEDYEVLEFMLDEVLSGTNLMYLIGEEENCIIGRSFSTIDDDETGTQFKQGVEKTMKDLFGDDIECFIHEGTWCS